MNKLTLLILGQRTFGGKLTGVAGVEEGKWILVDAIEFLSIYDQSNKSMIISGLIIGDLSVPEDGVLVEVSKSSPYYDQYFRVSGNIHGVN